ncbi:MAG TPA: DUF3821 domain-containing protein [Methanoregulaceae archaeon]|nr:DUF3821 domain-containing protein [Methanolinea sp.]MDD3090663.1 DUF3821 domain-containing protein [Methanoregulaceae archaeon]HOP67589.1 DUF3821 domain-containing protein [Methanoregulaceae archaeon]HPJ74781.1 DUF3821 domain-containing protein [Methanoregulaceae archaeon]HPQ76717.1 DUF3821 domain-containing protein [Methanoregulaceae archaeon]
MDTVRIFYTRWLSIALFSGLLLCAVPAGATLNTIPAMGTVFLGEEGLDVTATGVGPGSQIAWYGPGGSVTSVPSATVTVADPTDFYISPATFSGKTGAWFLLPSNSLAFYVQDPTLEVRVYDYSLNFEITLSSNWLPAGDAAGFRIETNLYEMAERPGVSGAPVTIRLKGPDGVEYSSLGSYPLRDIAVSRSPQETGAVWYTGSSLYPRGTYTVLAECDANDMKDNYPVTGKTISTGVTFVMQTTNPLIATPTTDRPMTTATMAAETSLPTTVVTTVATTVPATTETTPAETTVPATSPPPTTTPGFGCISILSGLCVAAALAFSRR